MSDNVRKLAFIGADTAFFIPALYNDGQFVKIGLEQEFTYLGYIGMHPVEIWVNVHTISFDLLSCNEAEQKAMRELIENRMCHAFINSDIGFENVTDAGLLLEYNIIINCINQ